MAQTSGTWPQLSDSIIKRIQGAMHPKPPKKSKPKKGY